MFIVFEGIDGSGKSTVSNQVAERLRSGGASVKHLRADGKFVSTVSQSIRDLARDARNLELVPKVEFLLYVARDLQLIEEALLPAIASHDVVLADRFLFTAEVQGQHGRHLPPEWMAPILRAASGALTADLVILIDVDPVVARARRKSSKIASNDHRPPSRKGLAGVGLQTRLRNGYLAMAANAPDQWVVVGNDQSLEKTTRHVTALIESALHSGTKHALKDYRRTPRAPRARTARIQTPEDALAAFLQWIDARSDFEPEVAAYMLGGLWGGPVDDRRMALAARAPRAVLAAMGGLDDDTSWILRKRLEQGNEKAVARSLAGVSDTQRCWALRERLASQAPCEVARSLNGMPDAAAWEWRDRLYLDAPDAIAQSLGHLDSERAWRLRASWLATHGDHVDNDYEPARIAARSVTSLGCERAWAIRERARAMAPVAALASIKNLRDSRSWAWRQTWLTRAPSGVMATLNGLLDPQAWDMRRAVGDDCKEALDSVVALDDPEAWEMRITHQDRWPSTVLKTLGPLADSDRGRALVEHQLSTYPTNVSLLKHASAIALGLHRVPTTCTTFQD